MLQKRAEFLATFCNINLENWQEAIDWFENIIINPASMEDSIFAIIDLGYTYFRMENSGYKSAYTGNLVEHKPTTKAQLIENRDYLLSLIPNKGLSRQMTDNIKQLKPGELLQNVPNPFNTSTQIWFKLENDAQVNIDIYDYTGKQIKSFSKQAYIGRDHFDFTAEGLPSGIYFYNLELNGQLADSKKMTVIK